MYPFALWISIIIFQQHTYELRYTGSFSYGIVLHGRLRGIREDVYCVRRINSSEKMGLERKVDLRLYQYIAGG